jgi:hypothetical protein
MAPRQADNGGRVARQSPAPPGRGRFGALRHRRHARRGALQSAPCRPQPPVHDLNRPDGNPATPRAWTQRQVRRRLVLSQGRRVLHPAPGHGGRNHGWDRRLPALSGLCRASSRRQQVEPDPGLRPGHPRRRLAEPDGRASPGRASRVFGDHGGQESPAISIADPARLARATFLRRTSTGEGESRSRRRPRTCAPFQPQRS